MKEKLVLLIALIVLLVVSLQSYCQPNSDNFLQLTIAPLNLIDPVTGVIQVGLQKKFSQRLAASLDYGLKFDKLSYASYNTDRKDYQYYKGKLELTYYIELKHRKPHSLTYPYLSVQGFYFPQQYRKENSWILKNNKEYHYDYSDVHRKVIVASFIVGEEERIRKRMIFNTFFGLGIRKMTIKHHTSGEVEGFMPRPKDFYFPPVDLQEGVFYRPHIALGFKIGYILDK